MASATNSVDKYTSATELQTQRLKHLEGTVQEEEERTQELEIQEAQVDHQEEEAILQDSLQKDTARCSSQQELALHQLDLQPGEIANWPLTMFPKGPTHQPRDTPCQE